MTVDLEALLEQARQVRSRAHAPYSHYRVGAAVLDENGQVHTGCNVENASFPEGICAEANAIGSLVAAGGSRILCIAVVGGRGELEACTPCGGCRQRICEFADSASRIVLLDADGSVLKLDIDDLLPSAFDATSLGS